MADFPLYECSKIFASLNTSSTSGVDITMGSSANTKGSWSAMSTSTELDASAILLTFAGASPVSGSDHMYLMDISIGSSTNEDDGIIIENICFTSDVVAQQCVPSFYLPIHIPAGSRVSARGQNDTANADVISVTVQYFATTMGSPEGLNGGFVTYGANTGTSNGTPVDAGGGGAGSWGAWEVFAASSSDDFKGFFLSVGTNDNPTMSTGNHLVDVGIGASTAEETIVSRIPVYTAGNEVVRMTSIFYPVPIPAGTRISLRAQTDITAVDDDTLSYTFHGAK